MKFSIKSFSRRIAFVICVFILVCLPTLITHAQGQPADCRGPFTVDGLQPDTISNTAGVTLVVTGSGFTDGGSIILQDFGGLQTTFMNGNLLNAALPANVPPGVYAITVVNGDGTCQEFSGLTVVGPTTTPTAKNTKAPSSTPAPTGTAAPTSTPAPTNFVRPILNIDSYSASSNPITPGQDFDSQITIVNWGSTTATNIVASVVAGDFTPRATGGLRTVGSLAPGEKWSFSQPFTASDSLWGKTAGTVTLTVTYTDQYGKTYTDTLTLGFNLRAYTTAVPSQTPTATPVLKAKLLITGYKANSDSIQPGSSFTPSLTVQNVGANTAKSVTLLYNGDAGAAQGAEFGTFAPENAANIQFVGDLAPGESATVAQPLIVSGSAKGGAYSLKFSIVYTDDQGQSATENQVISIVVQAPPSLDVGYSEEPEPFQAGQSNALPLQVTNRGLSAVTLGNIEVKAEGANLKNNIALIGSLDAGNYFTLDATIIPEHPGPLTLTITIDYTDAFNQPQKVVKTLPITIEGNEPAATPSVTDTQPKTSPSVWDNVWSAVLGFFGLGS
jgi:hypothetical protein